MSTIHAWVSAETALRKGSSVYRKISGDSVNVTRMSADKASKGSFWLDEKYVGEVISREDGGCVREQSRVPSISD